MELQITQTRHPKSVADGQTNKQTDRPMDGRIGPTTRPAFAKATQVKKVSIYYKVLKSLLNQYFCVKTPRFCCIYRFSMHCVISLQDATS